MTATIHTLRHRFVEGPVVEFNRPQRISEMVKVILDQGAHGDLDDAIRVLRADGRFDRVEIMMLAYDVWEASREEATVAREMSAP